MKASSAKQYEMTLQQLLSVLDIEVNEQIIITDLAIDSRKVTSGALFLAYAGTVADGRSFIEQAQTSGATAVLYESTNYELPRAIKIPAYAVDDLQAKIGVLADHFYQQPSSEMQVFGITGTNGKTTCCYLLAQGLSKLGLQTAMIGTLGVGKIDALANSGHTTPDPVAVHSLLAQWRDQGITQVCMEVSSHALDQGRVAGVKFFSALFTNLSHDHLDYHGDMQQYQLAKQRLFTDYQSELVITNADDAMGVMLIDIANSEFIASYGIQGGDVCCEGLTMTKKGMTFLVVANQIEFEIETSLIGEINIPNLLLVVATLLALSVDVEKIKEIIKALQPAPGRMELFTSDGSATQLHAPNVVIDYAHTPDALEKALLSIRKHCQGQLWCVFGCGGDRDKAKRSVMGEVAARLADKIIVTNDNPRSELPESIVADINSGISNNDVSKVQVILDRGEAVYQSIKQGASSDWVLVAGKGHEITQHIGDEVLDFSDREQVERCLGVAA